MYGGLMRSVLLHKLPPAEASWPWRAYVFPTEHGYRQGVVNIQVVLTDPSASGDVHLKLRFDGAAEKEVVGHAEGGKIELKNVTIPAPRLWWTTDPQLHTLTVLTANGEGVTERFGLRWWGLDAATARLTLNDKVLKLHGWNHHTQWPDTGGSPTEEQMDADIALLKGAGTNYVRGAHYPQDQRWLDRLDEHGIVMWEETLGPNVTVQNTEDWDYFMKFQLQQLNQMMDISMNHAAIMTWGWFNEGPSNSEKACPAYKACSDAALKRDPTRFRTWASNMEKKDKCLEHASLISFNSYPAWYWEKMNLSAPAAHWNDMADYVKTEFPGRPMVISETGAGGIYEWSENKTDAYWTQKYQVEVISRDVEVAMGNPRISGITLWHFFDFKGNDDAQATCGPCEYLPGVSPPTCSYVNVSCDRPGGLNHKGVVDFWRRQKQAYSVVGKMYNQSLAENSTHGGMNAEIVI
eukprot:TRINITY_DN23639_c0_g1_i1.p1 TRINITY_DN23639_c0_g1~~TRINITY_DN23639_c0_g1_i1.p1  ORF type:complete len:464 (+),score=91.85 TRINITY_DN23639_c0_g1_i1:234-1625(+)